MSNDTTSDTSQQSIDKAFTDPNEKNQQVSSSCMAVHSFPECSDRATPFSGSASDDCKYKDPPTERLTDGNCQPTNDTSRHAASLHHVPTTNHIREIMTGRVYADSRSHQLINNSEYKPSAPSVTAQLTAKVLMDSKKPSVLGEALEVMSIGDNCLEITTKNTEIVGRCDRMTDDESLSSVKGTRRKYTQKSRDDQAAGRWTPEEHQAFLEGLKIFGREWKRVAERIPTRTSAQIRSHAQKYFAKMARDESSMIQDQAATTAAAARRQQITNTIEASPMVSVVLSESVKRNVDRILADPNSLEKEVEDTLQALKERYFQLQRRLEESTRMNSMVSPPTLKGHIVENEDNYLPDIPKQTRPVLDGKKRYLDDCSDASVLRYLHDDMSSISSACFSPTRELVDEELIALSVLGGSLPRSASQQDLQNSDSFEEKSDKDPVEHINDAFETSSAHGHGERSDESDNRSDQSKKRKFSDEEIETTTKGRISDDGKLLNQDEIIP